MVDDATPAEDPRAVLFRLPPPRGPIAMVAALGLFLLAVGVVQEHNLLTHDPALFKFRSPNGYEVTGAERWFLVGVVGFMCFVFPVSAFIYQVRTPAFEVRRDRLRILAARVDVAMTAISGCRWARDRSLEIRVGSRPVKRAAVPVQHRAELEAVLRGLGKWDDPAATAG